MQRSRILFTGIIIIAILAITGLAGILPIPRVARVFYWDVVFSMTNPEDNAAELRALHKASKVKNADTGEETFNYTKRNRNLVDQESASCISCHGSMTDKDKKGNPKHYIHYKMLTAPMLSFSCTDCHKDVDTRKRSPSHVTMRVDRSLCPKCHNPKKDAIPLELSKGKAWKPLGDVDMPQLMAAHGTDEASGKEWIKNHPRVGMAIGIDKCRTCHIPGSELDFCRTCHLRGGFRPSHHRVVFEVPINEIYPKSSRTEVVQTRWKGYHFVVAREALEQLGAEINGPRNLPMDKVNKLPCGACHVLKEWCTRCHIRHNPNWLDPEVGHPAYVAKYGTKYCFRCHDVGGAKCQQCHTYAGQLK